ncbi:beta-N-acetylhexosaminidase [Rufibacter roseolus]|uniref:beta-N-acetylhexosaminidase n=1 Tax=Rufibacter roseolus TaxID=2817375 RepID=UPI001B3129DA|nr:family 20 glycosylhydrolase [Rufibacter roseolus]
MKKRWLSFLLGLFAVVSFRCQAQAPLANNIVPRPITFNATGEKPVTIDRHTVILADAPYKAQAEYLQGLLLDQCDLGLAISTPDAKPSRHTKIQLMHDTIEANRPEMYWLESGGPVIRIKARDVAGMVHGIQTLLQLLPLQKVKQVAFPTVEIKDYPRFAYRGMHLDVSRHIFPLDFLKKYIDYLAFHKFNNFHWHLTDDQGWRLEIKSYPKLTQVGAWRNSTLIGHFKDVPARYDSSRYGGFYTQDQVREIIAYAAIRGINVIPEIDIPGHSRAIIAAYPEFSTKPDSAWQVANTWGMYNRQNNVLAPNPETFRFLETMFQEVADLFPSPYIHIGGDECSKIWWKASPSTQVFMKANGLKDEKELQTYFIEQVSGYLAKKNKKVIGWHEILEGDLDTTAVVMNWGGSAEGIAAAKRRHPVIMTPGNPLYFDNYQSRNPQDSLAIHGYNPLEAVFQYNPLPAELQQLRLDKYILGAQGNVWTEYMASPAKVEYMVFPRMTALSEVLWTDPKLKDFTDFKRRLKTAILPRYAFWKSAYFSDFERWTLADK